MKNASILLMALVVLVSSCAEHKYDGLEQQDATVPIEEPGTTAVLLNSFAHRLYNTVCEDGEDILISPLSLSMPLALLSKGAAGETRREMLDAMGIDEHTASNLDAYFDVLTKKMTTQDVTTVLNIANALWINEDIPLKEEFFECCGDFCPTSTRTADFTDPGTADLINGWASENTNGRISKVVGGLDPNTLLLITNALYFKAPWAFKFKEQKKRLLAKLKVGTFCESRMNPQHHFMEDPRYHGVYLPYGNGSFAMKVFVPNEKDMSMKELSGLLCETQDECVGNYKYTIDMPAFSFSCENDFKGPLKSLGVKDAFDEEKSDFSNMSDTPSWVDDIKQMTFIDVNKDGTEAAAVTTSFSTFGGPSADAVNDLTIDSDFMFEIIDLHSGLILFIGQHTM